MRLEPGQIENFVELLRKCIMRRNTVCKISNDQVMHAVDRLNQRTCRAMDLRSPREAIFGVRMRYTAYNVSVAVRTYIYLYDDL